MTENTRPELTVTAAAKRSGYHPDTIRTAIHQRRLRAIRPGGNGHWRIDPDDLDAWMRGEPVSA